MQPMEYLQSGHVSEKTDAFAFGVVLCELLTGDGPVSDRARGEMLSVKLYGPLENPEQALPPLLDTNLGDDSGGAGWPLERAAALGRIARRCTEMVASRRSTVADELPELNKLAGREAVRLAGRGEYYDPKTGALVQISAAAAVPAVAVTAVATDRGLVRSSSSAALAARQDAASLVGCRMEVEGRGEGVVTAVQKELGKPTYHLVDFASDPAAGPLPVLLQKQKDGKGVKFYLIVPPPAPPLKTNVVEDSTSTS